MGKVDEVLGPHALRLFPAHPGATHDVPDGEALKTLYERFNGGYFWDGALLIRPLVGPDDEAPASVERWNEPGLWRDRYGAATAGVTFFAEDAFGVQFGLKGGAVLQFDPETAELGECAPTLLEWARAISEDPDFFTGRPVLRAWEKRHGKLAAGFRLVPKKLFMLGGEFHSENMIAKRDLEGMLIRAELWSKTRDIPDGQPLIFRKSP